jgi:hypothetical protein
LWDRFDSAKIVLFLGAGASLAEFSGNDSGDTLPTGRQLAGRLASCLRIAEDESDCDGLVEVVSDYALYTGRAGLEVALKEIFGQAVQQVCWTAL